MLKKLLREEYKEVSKSKKKPTTAAAVTTTSVPKVYTAPFEKEVKAKPSSNWRDGDATVYANVPKSPDRATKQFPFVDETGGVDKVLSGTDS